MQPYARLVILSHHRGHTFGHGTERSRPVFRPSNGSRKPFCHCPWEDRVDPAPFESLPYLLGPSMRVSITRSRCHWGHSPTLPSQSAHSLRAAVFAYRFLSAFCPRFQRPLDGLSLADSKSGHSVQRLEQKVRHMSISQSPFLDSFCSLVDTLTRSI